MAHCVNPSGSHHRRELVRARFRPTRQPPATPACALASRMLPLQPSGPRDGRKYAPRPIFRPSGYTTPGTLPPGGFRTAPYRHSGPPDWPTAPANSRPGDPRHPASPGAADQKHARLDTSWSCRAWRAPNAPLHRQPRPDRRSHLRPSRQRWILVVLCAPDSCQGSSSRCLQSTRLRRSTHTSTTAGHLPGIPGLRPPRPPPAPPIV